MKQKLLALSLGLLPLSAQAHLAHDMHIHPEWMGLAALVVVGLLVWWKTKS